MSVSATQPELPVSSDTAPNNASSRRTVSFTWDKADAPHIAFGTPTLQMLEIPDELGAINFALQEIQGVRTHNAKVLESVQSYRNFAFKSAKVLSLISLAFAGATYVAHHKAEQERQDLLVNEDIQAQAYKRAVHQVVRQRQKSIADAIADDTKQGDVVISRADVRAEAKRLQPEFANRVARDENVVWSGVQTLTAFAALMFGAVGVGGSMAAGIVWHNRIGRTRREYMNLNDYAIATLKTSRDQAWEGVWDKLKDAGLRKENVGAPEGYQYAFAANGTPNSQHVTMIPIEP